MKTPKLLSTLIFVLCLTAHPGVSPAQDEVTTIELENGTIIKGTISFETFDYISLDIDGITLTYDFEEIKSLKRFTGFEDEDEEDEDRRTQEEGYGKFYQSMDQKELEDIRQTLIASGALIESLNTDEEPSKKDIKSIVKKLRKLSAKIAKFYGELDD